MGFSLALIVMGFLIMLDRMGMGYGLRQGWPWIVVALGVGGLLRNLRSIPGWITAVIGILILYEGRYFIPIRIPPAVKTYFVPILLISLGLFWLWKYKKD